MSYEIVYRNMHASSGILHVSLNVGIGDILYAQHLLEKVKSNYSKIIICPHYGNLLMRNNNESIDPNLKSFTEELVNLCFGSDPVYSVEPTNPVATGPVWGLDFAKIVGIEGGNQGKPDFRFLCIPTTVNIPKPYIVIHTKARGFSSSQYQQHKNRLFEAYRQLSRHYTLVVMGDREINLALNAEYRNWPDIVFCIYPDLIRSGVPFVDRTAPKLIERGDMQHYREDCTIMRDAHAVLQMGVGGTFSTSVGLNKNCYCLFDAGDPGVHGVAVHLACQDHQYFNFPAFIDGIRSI